jgi:anaerobic magnesium-protoporphyrin IX monomethyl ester cyclase
LRIVLINPPHPSIGSRIPREQLPPLGLLSVGGPLIDGGHQVELIDGEFGPMPLEDIVLRAAAMAPAAILIGHSGSTSGHPIVARLSRMLRAALPRGLIIYGGVFPTYHWREILRDEPQIDIIVRGEGEATAVKFMSALEAGDPLSAIAGIAFRASGTVTGTAPAPVIADLDAFRIGWELIDHARYSYWGNKRAVVMQFSRGCPHPCNYCGQRGFWTRFRHRDPRKFAAEIAWLHRTHRVEVINFADENPTASRKAWRAFLEALIAEGVEVTLVASTRAGDIVRDADILHLYKQAGFERFLMGTENTDEATLALIRKGATSDVDRAAIRLLRRHDILSLATWVVGFEDESDRDLWNGLRRLVSYDPDQVTVMYVTPHRWTPFYRMAAVRAVVQTDQRRWDYKHQVLATRHMPPWRLFLWVKFIEIVAQVRPRALARLVWRRDPKIRHATRWYYRMGRRVWFHEIGNFLFRDRRVVDGPTLEELWGAPQDGEQEALSRPGRADTRVRVGKLDAHGRLQG